RHQPWCRPQGRAAPPVFTAEHLAARLDVDAAAAAGSMLGTRALQIFDGTVSVVRAVTRWLDFYSHEACGKCTPCREGTYWLREVLHRLEAGQGREGDVDLLLDIADNIEGRSFCAP